MNQTPRGVSEESKLSAIKTLAIIGFIATIIVLVWLAVMVVRFLPDAFGSLASIIESVSTTRRELQVSVNRTIVDVNDSVTVSWEKTGGAGIYGFSYSCHDGVAASLGASAIACDTWIPLPDDRTSAEFNFTSATQRFADIALAVRFTPADGEDAETKSVLVTIVNEAINEGGGVVTPEPAAPATTTPETPKPKPVTPVAPVSNPNGYTDLQIAYIGVGTYNEATRNFSQRSSLDNDSRVALRFEVKNIGTKTSSPWTYHATLPTEGTDVYRSDTQGALIPGERAIITVMFTTRERTGSASIEAVVLGGSDTRTGNNDFTKSISITN